MFLMICRVIIALSNEDIMLAIIGCTKLNISSEFFRNSIYKRSLAILTDQLDSAADKDSCVGELHNCFKSVDENYTKYTTEFQEICRFYVF